MIVTQKMAEDARATLDIYTELEDPEFDEELVQMSFRFAAKQAHPDAGGSAEAFAAVDRAKHVLLEWLKRPQSKPTAGAGVRCPKCSGKGHVISQRAWRGLRVQCPMCRGTGDLDSEHEKGDHR